MKLISIEDAIKLVKKSAKPIGVEKVLLTDAYGRVLAEDLKSGFNHPAVNVSAVDGYSVKCKDLENASKENRVKLKLANIIKAGIQNPMTIKHNETALVFTGAPVPVGADAVVMREDVQDLGNEIAFERPISQGKNIRFVGEDFKKGETVVKKGTTIGAAEIGMAAEINRSYLFVYRIPTVSIIPTGDELLDLGDSSPGTSAIRDSNSYTLTGLLRQAGAKFNICRRLKDDPIQTAQAIKSELERSDIVITTGGVSAGDYDFVKKVAPEIGVDIVFHGVLQKPGKPILFGRYKNNKYFFGLPGFPVSSTVGFLLYAYPLIRTLGGFADIELPRIQATLTEDFHRKKAKREELARVEIAYSIKDGFSVKPDTKKQGSGILTGMVGERALMDVPIGVTDIKKGSKVKVILIKPISSFSFGFF